MHAWHVLCLLLLLLQECLARTTFSPEHMVGAEGYKCESCKGLREATKQLQLFSYPQVLLLGLKRFETRGGSKGGNRAAAETYSSRKVGVDAAGLCRAAVTAAPLRVYPS